VPGQRHLLTSTRRPKAPAPRGPSRARAASRRHQKGRLAAVQGAPAAATATIRDFVAADAAAVNAVALAAFEQYRGEYADWPAFSSSVGAMANLAENGELIVAELDGRIAGAVAYFGPRVGKPALFDPDWPVIRMLVVDPAARGAGLGRLLTEECIGRARRDGADAIALHTSPIMQVALAMYLRRGFVLLRDSEPIFGVPYRIYLKRL
jgi:GNAT superfamily N-acetyltransferase